MGPPTFPNSGKTRFLPEGIDYRTAQLRKKRGRENVSIFLREKDRLGIRIDDPSPGADTYEVTVTFSP